MKVRVRKRIGFNQVDAGRRFRLKHLFDSLQEAAASHSHRAGCGPRTLFEQGGAWVLNKVGLAVERLPMLGEEIDILTWHKGTRGVRSYRDYQIRCGRELLVSAASLWLFLDLDTKRIVKPPADTASRYTVDPENATPIDLDGWRPTKSFQADTAVRVPTRPSDFDPLGHVNNASYLDYLDVLLDAQAVEQGPPRRLMIAYLKEVPAGLPWVTVSIGTGDGAQGRAGGLPFSISSPDHLHAAGEIAFG